MIDAYSDQPHRNPLSAGQGYGPMELAHRLDIGAICIARVEDIWGFGRQPQLSTTRLVADSGRRVEGRVAAGPEDRVRCAGGRELKQGLSQARIACRPRDEFRLNAP